LKQVVGQEFVSW